jgi:hypothetical protein
MFSVRQKIFLARLLNRALRQIRRLGAITRRLTGLKHVDLYATRQPLPEQPGESGSDKCG